MITTKTLNEIKSNTNTGVEYEIALFRCLLKNSDEINQVDSVIKKRCDARKIEKIIKGTSISLIMKELATRSMIMVDVSFETQNDAVGPADVVMIVETDSGKREQLGLSVKYSNTCTLNATGRKFLTEDQVVKLKNQLPVYIDDYVSEMKRLYGSIKNWFRRRKSSVTTDRFIDKIRDEVILNWQKKSERDRISILKEAYQENSPIDYWVVTYKQNLTYRLETSPYKIDTFDMNRVELRKYETSYVGFFLDDQIIGKMQVKFNNGIVERCKGGVPDKVVDGVEMNFGQPFSSWNFCLVRINTNEVS